MVHNCKVPWVGFFLLFHVFAFSLARFVLFVRFFAPNACQAQVIKAAFRQAIARGIG